GAHTVIQATLLGGQLHLHVPDGVQVTVISARQPGRARGELAPRQAPAVPPRSAVVGGRTFSVGGRVHVHGRGPPRGRLGGRGARFRGPGRGPAMTPMPAPPAPLPESAIVTRLRAAGCVFAEDEARLLLATARTPAELSAMVDRRTAGHPLEHVLGWADFCGLRVAVDPGVFVPRRRTEFLVRQAIAIAPPRPVVVDLCCGSGAVGAALAAAL